MDWTDPMVNETKIVNHQEGRIHIWDWRKFIKKKNCERDISVLLHDQKEGENIV